MPDPKKKNKYRDLLYRGKLPKGSKKVPNPRYEGPKEGSKTVKPLGKYDEAKRIASQKLGPHFNGMFWLKSIDPRINLKPFTKSIVAKKIGEDV